MTLKHPIGTKLVHSKYSGDVVEVVAHLPVSKEGGVERYLVNRGERKTRISESTCAKEYTLAPAGAVVGTRIR